MKRDNLVQVFRVSFVLDIQDKFGNWNDNESYNAREEKIERFFILLADTINFRAGVKLRMWEESHFNIEVDVEKVSDIVVVKEKITQFIENFEF